MSAQAILSRPLLVRTGRSTRTTSGGVALFDDVAVQRRLVWYFLTAEQSPLLHTAMCQGPGVYALWYRGPHPLYADLDPRDPIYTGKGAIVRERLSSHRQSLAEVYDLDPAHFTVATLQTTALVHAEVAEHLLHGAFRCRWNDYAWTGFGSRPRGSGRSQKPTKWDRIHPGRKSRASAASDP